MSFRITRRIEIDAGHRIMTHGSKCRNLHGHRYVIEAECEAQDVWHAGEQTDMVLDFGFLKEEMLTAIDHPCDHGFIASLDDREILEMYAPKDIDPVEWMDALAARAAAQGGVLAANTKSAMKLYVVPFQPTAERLAKHWFEALDNPVRVRSQGTARLVAIKVWETPNCVAEYRPA